jgi:hypothetical protein
MSNCLELFHYWAWQGRSRCCKCFAKKGASQGATKTSRVEDPKCHKQIVIFLQLESNKFRATHPNGKRIVKKMF